MTTELAPGASGGKNCTERFREDRGRKMHSLGTRILNSLAEVVVEGTPSDFETTEGRVMRYTRSRAWLTVRYSSVADQVNVKGSSWT